MDTKPEQPDICQNYARRIEQTLNLNQVFCEKTSPPKGALTQLSYIQVSWAWDPEDEQKFTRFFPRCNRQGIMYTVSLPQYSLEEILNKEELHSKADHIKNILKNMGISALDIFLKKSHMLEIHLASQTNLLASHALRQYWLNHDGKRVFVIKIGMEELFNHFGTKPAPEKTAIELPSSKGSTKARRAPMPLPAAMNTLVNPAPAIRPPKQKQPEEKALEKRNPLETAEIIAKASKFFINGREFASTCPDTSKGYSIEYLKEIKWIPGGNLITARGPHYQNNAFLQLDYLKKHAVSQIVGLGQYLAANYALENHGDFTDYCLEKRTLTDEKNPQKKLVISGSDSIEITFKHCRTSINPVHHSRLHYHVNESDFEIDFAFFKVKESKGEEGFINLDADKNDQMKEAIWIIYQKSLNAPVLVECKDGAGLTGHFVLMLEIIKNYEAIFYNNSAEKAAQHIHRLLENLRTFEPAMVHTSLQFEKAIYNASQVYQYALKKDLLKQEKAQNLQKENFPQQEKSQNTRYNAGQLFQNTDKLKTEMQPEGKTNMPPTKAILAKDREANPEPRLELSRFLDVRGKACYPLPGLDLSFHFEKNNTPSPVAMNHPFYFEKPVLRLPLKMSLFAADEKKADLCLDEKTAEKCIACLDNTEALIAFLRSREETGRMANIIELKSAPALLLNTLNKTEAVICPIAGASFLSLHIKKCTNPVSKNLETYIMDLFLNGMIVTGIYLSETRARECIASSCNSKSLIACFRAIGGQTINQMADLVEKWEPDILLDRLNRTGEVSCPISGSSLFLYFEKGTGSLDISMHLYNRMGIWSSKKTARECMVRSANPKALLSYLRAGGQSMSEMANFIESHLKVNAGSGARLTGSSPGL